MENNNLHDVTKATLSSCNYNICQLPAYTQGVQSVSQKNVNTTLFFSVFTPATFQAKLAAS